MKLEPKPVAIKTLVEGSLRIIREKALKHRIHIETDVANLPETITADERKLKQILFNLLSNAVKFTPDGGKIKISGVLRRAGDTPINAGHSPERPLDNYADLDATNTIEISVEDTGIGLDSENLEMIFDPFDQVEGSRSRKFQGIGLGLAITKQFVGLHGGSIWAASKGWNQGSAFSFVLPCAPDPGPGGPAAAG
jgi:signal transduction histidine kinase